MDERNLAGVGAMAGSRAETAVERAERKEAYDRSRAEQIRQDCLNIAGGDIKLAREMFLFIKNG